MNIDKTLAGFVLLALVIPSVMAFTGQPDVTTAPEQLNDPPTKPSIQGPSSGKTGTSYTYTFQSTDPDGDDINYCFTWGDGDGGCTNYVSSGEEATVSHTWDSDGDYTVEVYAEDKGGAKSDTATMTVTMPLSYGSTQMAYSGMLRVYIVEPTSRWDNYDGDPYHFGFLDFAVEEELAIPYGETVERTVTWNPGEAGYSDVSPDNVMAIAAVFNPRAHEGHAYPPFRNPFDAYYVDAAAAAQPGETGRNANDGQFTHTVLVEEGTATWCPYCPAMAEALNTVYESGEIPMYFTALVADKSTKASSRLSEDYNLYGYPTSFVDGGRTTLLGGGVDADDFRDAVGEAATQDVHELDLSMSAVWNDGAMEMNLSVTNNEEGDTTAPELSITKPVPGGVYFQDELLLQLPFSMAILVGNTTLQVDASDDMSGIARVDFSVCGELVATDTEAPYECTYDGTFGSHTLRVVAYDGWGNTAEDVLNLYVI
ncbi:MAG: Ig-like domain-containing protein [Thermoplasmatota archaeon]